MSVQIFLQGKILGIEQFLLASSSDMDGRSHWGSTVERGFAPRAAGGAWPSKMLLGSSGGEQFLVVLPVEFRGEAGKVPHGCRSTYRSAQRRRPEKCCGPAPKISATGV